MEDSIFSGCREGEEHGMLRATTRDPSFTWEDGDIREEGWDGDIQAEE